MNNPKIAMQSMAMVVRCPDLLITLDTRLCLNLSWYNTSDLNLGKGEITSW